MEKVVMFATAKGLDAKLAMMDAKMAAYPGKLVRQTFKIVANHVIIARTKHFPFGLFVKPTETFGSEPSARLPPGIRAAEAVVLTMLASPIK